MRFGKRGDIATYQIVITILAVLAIIIILIFYFAFKDTTNVSDNICHLSALTRATSPEAASSYVPLKCTTKKICLTMSGSGKCADSFAGEQDVTTVILPSDALSAARVIEQTSADAMYSCWSLLGEGKLDLFGNFKSYSGLWLDFNNIKPYCVVCSRVAIDNSVPKTTVLDKVDIYTYMKRNVPVGQSLTYLQLFTDKQFNAYPVVDQRLFQEKIVNDSGNTQISFTRSEIAFLFMQIKTKSAGQVLSNLGTVGAITIGGSFLTGPARSAAGAIIFAGGAAAAIYKIAVVGGIATQAAINAYSGQVMAAGYCGEFSSENADSKSWWNGNVGTSGGCSLVESVPYNAQSINQICGTIDGNP